MDLSEVWVGYASKKIKVSPCLVASQMAFIIKFLGYADLTASKAMILSGLGATGGSLACKLWSFIPLPNVAPASCFRKGGKAT